jgi:HEAT repeat protein
VARLLPRLALALAALAAAASPAAADVVQDLVERYRSVAGRHDDVAYEVQREAIGGLADLGTPAARRAIRSFLDEERNADRRRFLLLLAGLVRGGGPDDVDEALHEALVARDPAVLEGLPRVLAAARGADARAHLRGKGLTAAPAGVKPYVARALGAMGDKAAVLPLVACLGDSDARVRAEVLLALGELGDETAFTHMAVQLKSPDARVRAVAARALGVLGSSRAVPHLAAALADSCPRVVEQAAGALGLLGAQPAIEPLIERMTLAAGTPAPPTPPKRGPEPPPAGPDDLRLLDALERALERITGMTLGDDPDLWRAWWKEAKTRAADPTTRPNAPTTIAGPRYYGLPVRSSRVAFVIDVSRSMAWNGRLETAQKELVQALERLPSRTKFGIVAFSDTAKSWEEKLLPATPENVRRAVRFVERLDIVNGTNAWDGLREAFRDEDVDTVFFLSDGSPTVGAVVEPDSILAQVREMNLWRRVRVHTVALLRGEPPADAGLGENPETAAAFMKRLAEENDGQFREIR